MRHAYTLACKAGRLLHVPLCFLALIIVGRIAVWVHSDAKARGEAQPGLWALGTFPLGDHRVTAVADKAATKTRCGYRAPAD